MIEDGQMLVMYRVPAEPVERLLALAARCEGEAADAIVQILIDYCAQPEVQRLLLSASRDLCQALAATRELPEQSPARARTARALAGYLSRLSTRCTPFGLLAVVGCCELGEPMDLTLPSAAEDTAIAVLAPYLGVLLAPALRSVPHSDNDPTLYSVRGRPRRYEYRGGSWHLCEVAADPPNESDIPAAMSATEPDCVEQFLARFANTAPVEQAVAASELLDAVQSLRGALSADWMANYDVCQTRIDALLAMLNPAVATSERRASRTLLCGRVCPASLKISPSLVEEIHVAASILHRLQGPSETSVLQQFSLRFTERYGDTFVPVLEAIDPGHGVGYTHGEMVSLGIVDGPLPQRQETRFTALTIGELLLSARMSDEETLAVSPDWADSTLDHKEYAVLGCLARDDRFHLNMISIGDALPWFGRFAPDVPGLTDKLKRWTRMRPETDILEAEVVYVPFGYDANVVRRAAIYTHEIVCYGQASRHAIPIPVNELMVGIENGRLRLWWHTAGKWVRPRLTCAHNVHINLYPIYRFFADLARDNIVSTSWSWGPMHNVRQLPAVTCGRVELSPRTWLVDGVEASTLFPESTRMSRMAELREIRGIPRWVQAGVGDNLIDIDLQNPVFVDVLLHKIKKGDRLLLRQSQMASTNVVVRDGMTYCNEIVIARPARRATPPMSAHSPVGADKAQRPAASSWLTLKLYEERTYLESLFVDDLLPWVEERVRGGVLEKWHFLRYADPRQHFRLRIQGTPDALADALRDLSRLLTGVAFTVEPYWPESARYGGDTGMGICESVFMADSRMASEIIRLFPKDLTGRRWELSIGVINVMLDVAAVPISDRVGLFTRMRDGYASVLGADLSLLPRSLDVAYRQRRATIERSVKAARGTSRAFSCYASIAELSRRSSELEAPLLDVLSSLIHMHSNRVFSARQSEQEVALYDYLRRYYRSEMARA